MIRYSFKLISWIIGKSLLIQMYVGLKIVIQAEIVLKYVIRWLHYVLRAWKSFNVTTWVQTSIFRSQIIVENGFWGQTNQLQIPPISDFFKILFLVAKIVKKIGGFVDFWIFLTIYVHK